uniref:Lipocalin/cytosolic fatty-acid binding domain-containing protein n=1 Tax=Castor canadensis TaxID=51338 RepID=A0A8C0XL98_CASCN
MKTLLLVFGLGLIAAMQAQTLPAVEEDQDVSGTWYLKAVASDKGIPGKMLGSVSVTPMTVKILEEGSLEIKFTARISGQCWKITTVLEKTDEPGKYTAYGGRQVVHIIKSDVEDHYILYGVGKLAGHQIQMAKLVGRDPEINQEALKDFKEFSGFTGLDSENMIIPQQRETCPPSLGFG